MSLNNASASQTNMESSINIQLVHGGFILSSADADGWKTEVFTSQAKLLKAVRTVIEANSLVRKTNDKAEDAAE